MRINRLVAGAVSAGLLGLTPIAIASPSSATENRTVTVTAAPTAEALIYGNETSVRVAVTDTTTGTSTSYGNATLYAQEAGTADFVPVETGTYPSSSFTVKPKATTTYKVVYNGYAATSTYQNNFAAAESAPFTVQVQRKVTLGLGKAKLTLKGKIAPDYGKKKVKFQIKKGGKYKPFKTIKTDKKGKFLVRFPAPRRPGKIFFKIIVPGDSKFLGYTNTFNTTTY